MRSNSYPVVKSPATNNRHFNMKKKCSENPLKLVIFTLLNVTGTLHASSVEASQENYANFIDAGSVSNMTLLTPQGSGATSVDQFGNYTFGGPGYVFGSTNNVSFSWDGTLFNSNSDYTGPGSVSNASISSPTQILAVSWEAHTVQLFGPGTYSFDTSLGGGVPESGIMNMTVAEGQIGMHLLFDWHGSTNIDIVNVFNINSTFSSCGYSEYEDNTFASNCLYDAPGSTNPAGNTPSTVFTLASTDNDGDGTLGVAMNPYGPFGGFNFNFNLQGTISTVPVPAAVWLFGSGLIGLFGIAFRKK